MASAAHENAKIEGDMKDYLLSIYQPDGPPPPSVDLEQVMRDIGALIDDMKAAGAWVFNGGLAPPSTATVLRYQRNERLMTDGPFVEGKEHVGGFIVIRAGDLDAALAWGDRLGRILLGLPIEVRPFQTHA